MGSLARAMCALEIPSNTGGAVLLVTAGPRFYFTATLMCGPLRTKIEVDETDIQGLATFFEGLAGDWRGWTGERTWEAVEEEMGLRATHNGLGTVTLRVQLRSQLDAPNVWAAQGTLRLGAGGLDAVVRAARSLVEPQASGA